MRVRPAGGPSGDQPATDPPEVGDTPTHRRRAAVLAGHRGALADAERASRDDDPTVRAAGLGALARLGRFDLDCAARAAHDEDAAVRRRACELVGRQADRLAGDDTPGHPGPDAPAWAGLMTLLIGRLADEDGGVAEMAAWALGELAPVGGPETGTDGPAPVPSATVGRAVQALAAVATTHADPLCREAAVAALGAIGDPAGLPAVLDALGGPPPLRRRAAVALAAFDDPRAEAALGRCLTDRDWQVREVAEELLGRGPTS